MLAVTCQRQKRDKTWNSLLHSRTKRRSTLAVFGMYECSKCGKKFRAVVSKAKLGAEGIEP